MSTAPPDPAVPQAAKACFQVAAAGLTCGPSCHRSDLVNLKMNTTHTVDFQGPSTTATSRRIPDLRGTSSERCLITSTAFRSHCSHMSCMSFLSTFWVGTGPAGPKASLKKSAEKVLAVVRIPVDDFSSFFFWCLFNLFDLLSTKWLNASTSNRALPANSFF